jgi:hypothetical protein
MEVGFVDWWMLGHPGEVFEEGIELFAWFLPDLGDDDPQRPSGVFTAEIDGVSLGELEGDPVGGLFLSLCSGCPQQVPPDLTPVSEIDVIRVVDDSGAEVMSGSFSDPCVPGWKSRAGRAFRPAVASRAY